MAEEAQEQMPAEKSQLPEEFQGKSAQDIYNALLSERNRAQELNSKLSAFDRYGGPEAFAEAYNTLYQRYASDNAQAPQQAQQQPQQQTPQQQPQTDFADWDLLSPQEQYQRLSQNVTQQVAQAAQQYIDTLAQQRIQEFQQQQEQALKQQRTEWDIYRRALEVKQRNPNVDMEQLLQTMVETATGDTNSLMDLALGKLTAEQDAENRAQALYEAKLADLEQQRQNEAMQVLAGNPNGPLGLSKREEAPKSVREENALIAKRLVEDGTLTPGHFAP